MGTRRESGLGLFRKPVGGAMAQEANAVRVRTLFLSDLHLGTKGCQADALLEFLKAYDADTIYLVGDIVDGWKLKSGWYWPQAHNDVVQKLLRKVRKGARLVYLPGNHDEFLRDFIGVNLGGIELADYALHEAADGKRYLVIHGDQFDLVVRHARWLALLGDGAYSAALFVNTYLNVGAKAPRPDLLVALVLGQAEGQECGELHQPVRGTPGGRSPAAGGRWRHLRPYPPCDHA